MESVVSRHSPSFDADDSFNPVEIINPSGAGNFVLACEHASHYIPPQFNRLNLPEALLQSHIAWDPGALDVARRMSLLLDSPLVAQRVSRLIYDCNRAPMTDAAMPAVSEVHAIGGNAGLSEAQREERTRRYYAPFHSALSAVVERRLARPPPAAMLTVHSFSPVYKGVRRDLDIGLINDADSRFAERCFAFMRTDDAFTVRRNAPYSRSDGVTHTLAVQAVARGMLNVMIEIRNDWLESDGDRQNIAMLLSDYVRRVSDSFVDGDASPNGV